MNYEQILSAIRILPVEEQSELIYGDQVALIVTADRSGSMDLTVATMGRIEKKNIGVLLAIGL